MMRVTPTSAGSHSALSRKYPHVSMVTILHSPLRYTGLWHAKQSRLHELQRQAGARAAEQEQGLGLLQDMPSNSLQVCILQLST